MILFSKNSGLCLCVGHEVGAYLPNCFFFISEQSDWVKMQIASLQTEYWQHSEEIQPEVHGDNTCRQAITFLVHFYCRSIFLAAKDKEARHVGGAVMLLVSGHPDRNL